MEQYRGGMIEQQQDGTFSASYLKAGSKPYQALAGQGYGFQSADAARAAIDAAVDAQTARASAASQPGSDSTAEQRMWYANHGVPTTAAQAKRIDQRAASKRCRRCGCSEADGAMFTTVSGGNICDDCI